MVLSPQDIHNKEFSVKMRGYNIDQVNDFLDQIIKDYQITIKQNEDLRAALNETQAKLKRFNELQVSLNESLLVAQQTANNVKEKAQVDAQKIVGDANNQSNLMLRNANQQVNQITMNANQQVTQMVSAAEQKLANLKSEINTLKQSAISFRRKSVTLLKEQVQMTKNDKWDELLDTNYDGSLDEIEQSLDSISPQSVESKQGSAVNQAFLNPIEQNLNPIPSQNGQGPSVANAATTVYYPDGLSKQI